MLTRSRHLPVNEDEDPNFVSQFRDSRTRPPSRSYGLKVVESRKSGKVTQLRFANPQVARGERVAEDDAGPACVRCSRRVDVRRPGALVFMETNRAVSRWQRGRPASRGVDLRERADSGTLRRGQLRCSSPAAAARSGDVLALQDRYEPAVVF